MKFFFVDRSYEHQLLCSKKLSSVNSPKLALNLKTTRVSLTIPSHSKLDYTSVFSDPKHVEEMELPIRESLKTVSDGIPVDFTLVVFLLSAVRAVRTPLLSPIVFDVEDFPQLEAPCEKVVI